MNCSAHLESSRQRSATWLPLGIPGGVYTIDQYGTVSRRSARVSRRLMFGCAQLLVRAGAVFCQRESPRDRRRCPLQERNSPCDRRVIRSVDVLAPDACAVQGNHVGRCGDAIVNLERTRPLTRLGRFEAHENRARGSHRQAFQRRAIVGFNEVLTGGCDCDHLDWAMARVGQRQLLGRAGGRDPLFVERQRT